MRKDKSFDRSNNNNGDGGVCSGGGGRRGEVIIFSYSDTIVYFPFLSPSSVHVIYLLYNNVH